MRMIEKPNIPDEKIISTLRENYLIPITGTEFLPLGLDAASWAFRVDAEDNVYFLKIRKGIPNPAGILIPRFLKEQGIEQVMAPIASLNDHVWENVDDFQFILYPFIKGAQVMDAGMSDEHWIEFGAVLKRLHTTKISSELLSQIRREMFIPKRLEWDKEFHHQVKAHRFDDLYQNELAECWSENFSTISTILERTDSLAQRMKANHPEFVLCHADIHTGNVLRTEDDQICIVDWDETMLAPKERDLLFIIGSIFGDISGGRAEQLFFEGYGETRVDPLALAYYRYDWCVEDMGEFAAQVFESENSGEETKRNAIRWFKYLFAKGNSIDLALQTKIEI